MNLVDCFLNTVHENDKLTNCKEYTGYCFRRTSSTLYADAGADILVLTRLEAGNPTV